MWRTNDGYQFEESKAQIEDHFLGLGIDEDGQNERTSARVEKWVNQVLGEFDLA